MVLRFTNANFFFYDFTVYIYLYPFNLLISNFLSHVSEL